MFIPYQIYFWNHFNIKFIALLIGKEIPEVLLPYSDIILWNKNLVLNASYVGQNLRIYYPALLNIPDNEMLMITDMDMLPTERLYIFGALKTEFLNYGQGQAKPKLRKILISRHQKYMKAPSAFTKPSAILF